MSFRSENIKSLVGTDLNGRTKQELSILFNEILKGGMHGLCFSPYLDGQFPGSQISEQQIRERMAIIAPYTKWVRTFSCTDGNEKIPVIAREFGLKSLVGAWLGRDKTKNRKEINNLIALAKEGYADIVAVGNEVMYRGDLTEEELLEEINAVKRELPNCTIGYVDAYYEFCNRPAIIEVCDVILANCYPFWEGCSLEYSLLYMKDMYNRARKAANGKKVIISETGWPNKGTAFGDSIPSFKKAIKYFINSQNWAREDNIEMFYFTSFDELWKTEDEGDVGAYWGLWDKNGRSKYSIKK